MISNPKIDANGTKRWYNKKGEYHRDGDLPAVEQADGTKAWYIHDMCHREQDKPAIEWADGAKAWYKNGERHREQDKPAVEWADGSKAWYKNGIPLSNREIEALQRKWTAIRNGDTTLLAEELINDL